MGDENLAKQLVRPDVEEEVRKKTDELLIMQLKNLKAQLESMSDGKKKKGKKGKGGGKKKKGKGGGKKKKGKGKKEKPLPGAKQCSGMTDEEMLIELVEQQMIKMPDKSARVGCSDSTTDHRVLHSAARGERHQDGVT